MARVQRGHDYWSVENELSAVAIEIMHAHLRAFLAAYGVKRSQLPPAISLPRPTAVQPNRPQRRHAHSVQEVVSVLAAGHKR